MTDGWTEGRTDGQTESSKSCDGKMKLSELASSFRCNKFEDYICKNSNLNTKNAEITNEVIMCIFKGRYGCSWGDF